MEFKFYKRHKGIKDCYVDKNGNIYSLMRFKDLGTIEEVAKTNINCKNCIDCKECENCINCEYCIGCKNCIDCIECEYCVNAIKSKFCNDSKNIISGYNLRYSKLLPFNEYEIQSIEKEYKKYKFKIL